jgi:hypothetical protein
MSMEAAITIARLLSARCSSRAAHPRHCFEWKAAPFHHSVVATEPLCDWTPRQVCRIMFPVFASIPYCHRFRLGCFKIARR